MYRRFKISLLLSSGLIALTSTLAVAEPVNCKDPQANPESCEPVESTSGGTRLAPITVLGSRAPVDVSKYPGSVSVVEEDDLKTSDTVIDALKKVPGFETGGGMGRSIGQQYSIRGFGYQSESRVIIKMDGVRRSPSLFSNHISSFRVDPTILKRVEVVKGVSSILHGTGAIGGVVGMTTKDAEDYIKPGRESGVTTEMRYETNNMLSAGVTMAVKPKDGPIDIMGHIRFVGEGDIGLADGGTATTKQTDHDSMTRTLFGKIGWQVNNEHRLQFSAFEFKQDLTTVWQTIYHSKIDGDGPIEGLLNQRDFVLDYTFKDGDNSLFDFSSKLYFSKASYDRGWSSFSDPTDNGNYVNDEERWGVSAKNIARFKMFALEHRLTTGFDYDHRAEDAIFTSDGVVDPIGSMPNKYTDTGFYIQDDITIVDGLTLTVGGRYDMFYREVIGKSEYDGSNLSPRIGAAFEVFDGITLLANYSESFRAPTPNESNSEGPLNPHYYYIPNPDLNPETGKEYEVGFSIEQDNILTRDDRLSLKAIYFNGKIEDMIALRVLNGLPTNPPQSNEWAQYQNVSEAERNGYEITGQYWSGPWMIEGSYEHLDIYDSETKEKVPQGFADKLRLAGSYTYQPWDLTFGAEVSHWFKPDQNPETIVSRGVTYTYVNEDYTKANLKLAWKPTQTGYDFLDNGLEVVAGVNNVFDGQYLNARNVTTTSRVGKERNYFITVKKSF
jgi:hemoglobin/transferrin/lactoferrin receptor protein